MAERASVWTLDYNRLCLIPSYVKLFRIDIAFHQPENFKKVYCSKQYIGQLKRFWNEESGQALLSVLAVMVILSTLMAAVFASFLAQKKLFIRDGDRIQALYLAEAGVFLAVDSLFKSNKPDLPVEYNLLLASDSIHVRVRSYGLFLNIQSTVTKRGRNVRVNATVGAKPHDYFQNAIVIGDISNRVILADQPRIQGDILVGPLGYETTTFRGRPYRGQIEGNIISERGLTMPNYDNYYIKQWETYVESLFLMGEEQLLDDDLHYTEETLILTDETFQQLPTAIISGKSILVDRNTSLPTGTILLARESIEFSAFSHANDIIVDAGGFINIGQGSQLSGQFIARDSIAIGDNAYQIYPSLLYLKGDESQDDNRGVIKLGDNATVDGSIVIPPLDVIRGFDRRELRIPESAVVRGAIINAARTELYGEVHGSVVTHQFYYYSSPTQYVNWLMNFKISVYSRPDGFVAPFGIGETGSPMLMRREVM